MSQIVFPLVPVAGGRELVVGYDRPFRTFFAQLWDPGAGPEDSPVQAAGYHPDEQLLDPSVPYGPYPLDLMELDRVLASWGIDGDLRQEVGRRLAQERGQ